MLQQLIVLLVGVAMLSWWPGGAFSQSSATEIELTIRLDAPISQRPTPFIYVKGELAGVAPGTINLPNERDGVVIEIGIPRLGPNPIYSFVIGSAQIEKARTEVIISNFSLMQFLGKNAQKYVALAPNSKQEVVIRREGQNSISVVLPAGPYQIAAGLWTKPASPDPNEKRFTTLAADVNDSAKFGLKHFRYRTAEEKAVGVSTSWSGSIQNAGLFDRNDLPKKQWTIISNPGGANIFTDEGPQGTTTTTIQISTTSGLFVVLKKDGYAECPHTQCRREDTQGSVMLTCDLKKRR